MDQLNQDNYYVNDEAVKLCALYEEELNKVKEELKDNQVIVKLDAGDGRENFAKQAVEDKINMNKKDIENLLFQKKVIKNMKPITKSCICLASWFKGSYNGINLTIYVSTFTKIDEIQNGFLIVNIESPLGQKLIGLKPGQQATVKNETITIEKII